MSKQNIEARCDLREVLRKIRMALARYLRKAPFIIFHDKTLDALVEQLPCNMSELLSISPGFGPKNSQSLGPMLLLIIRDYKRKLFNHTTSRAPPSKIPLHKLKRSDEDEMDEVVFESETSIDNMIQKKIKEAEEQGDVIELES